MKNKKLLIIGIILLLFSVSPTITYREPVKATATTQEMWAEDYDDTDSDVTNPQLVLVSTDGDAMYNDGDEIEEIFDFDTTEGTGTGTSLYAAIPEDYVIDDINVTINGRGNRGESSAKVRLYHAGTSSWTSYQFTPENGFGMVHEDHFLDGTWGKTWSKSDFSDANFKIEVACQDVGGSDGILVDYVNVKVTYSEPPNYPPVIDTDTESPTNQSSSNSAPITLSVDIDDADDDSIEWWLNVSEDGGYNYVNLAHDTDPDGDYTISESFSGSDYNATYYWKVEVIDGEGGSDSEIFHFQIEDSPYENTTWYNATALTTTDSWIGALANVQNNDSLYLLGSLGQDDNTGYINVSDFDIDVPSGVEIKGVQFFIIDKSNDNDIVYYNTTQLLGSSGTPIGDDLTDYPNKIYVHLTKTYRDLPFNGTVISIWNASLTESIVESSNFGLSLNFARHDGAGGNRGVYIYYIACKVYYTEVSIPEITINFAGNLSDSGGPYWRPPSTNEVLTYEGYYTNNSQQQEDWIYINCTITNATSVYLDWLNETTWTNGTYALSNTAGDYWEINTSGTIQTHEGYKYSFNINASNEAVFSISQWNKSVEGGYTRRYVQLNCTPESIGYTPFYLWEADYGVWSNEEYSDYLRHDQGQASSSLDTGFLKNELPSDTVQYRDCGTYIGYWFENDTCVEATNISNVYRHYWLSMGDVPAHHYLWWNDTSYRAAWSVDNPGRDSYEQASNDNHSYIYYDNGIGVHSNDYYLYTNQHNYTGPRDFTDNNIYEVLIGFRGVSFPSIISNRSFNSFVIFNVPNNNTLNTTDWSGIGGYVGDYDGDNLTCWEELYVYATNPFLSDTDNDGYNDDVDGFPNNYQEVMDGVGSEANPYQITNWGQLHAVRDYLWANFSLQNNLDKDSSGYEKYANLTANGGEGWNPIGTVANFTGRVFEGNGYVISDLWIDRSQDYVGLFARVLGTTANPSLFSNVSLTNINITNDGAYDYTGGLIAFATNSTIINCSYVGNLTGETVSSFMGGLIGSLNYSSLHNCSSNVHISGSKSYCGGIVGSSNHSYINDSFAIGSITGYGNKGGIVGELQSSRINRCYANVDVSLGLVNGGLIGWARYSSLINNSYAMGDVSVATYYAGGFIGMNSICTITNSYATGNVTKGIVGVGGFCSNNGGTITDCYYNSETGYSNSDGGTGKTIAELKMISTYTNWDISSTTVDLNDGYPYLSWQNESSEAVWLIPGTISEVILTLPSVYPASGVSSYTTFYFNVTWTHPSSSPEDGYLKVNITAQLIPDVYIANESMTWISGDNTTGAIYSYSTTLTTGSSYVYTFYAYDGTSYNSSGPHSGPTVSAQSIAVSITTASNGGINFTEWLLDETGVGLTYKANVPEDNQSDELPAINITNTGNVPLTIYLNWTSNPGSGILAKWNTSNNTPAWDENVIAIDPLYSTLSSELTPLDSLPIWVWMNFTAVPAQSVQLDLSIYYDII